jgi:hypothetical protein
MHNPCNSSRPREQSYRQNGQSTAKSILQCEQPPAQQPNSGPSHSHTQHSERHLNAVNAMLLMRSASTTRAARHQLQKHVSQLTKECTHQGTCHTTNHPQDTGVKERRQLRANWVAGSFAIQESPTFPIQESSTYCANPSTAKIARVEPTPQRSIKGTA